MCSRPRFAAFAVVLVLAAAGCADERVLHPTFGADSAIAGAPAPPSPALRALSGMYQAMGRRFGTEVAVRGTRNKVSIFATVHRAYAILAPGCLDGGSRLVL